MGRLIDADELKKKLQARHDNGNDDFDKGYNIGLGTTIDLIDCAPTVEERPQGEWVGVVYSNNRIGVGMCNQCGVSRIIDKFCSNCGAEMQKGGAE